jgi:hypothetical protein
MVGNDVPRHGQLIYLLAIFCSRTSILRLAVLILCFAMRILFFAQ